MDAPLFVKIEKYKELTEVLSQVDAKLKEANAQLEKLKKLKMEEDAQIATWEANLGDLQARSRELHSNLFQ